MKYLTEREILSRFSCHAMSLANEVKKGAEVSTLADDMPAPVHFNHARTLEIQLTNRVHAELTGYYFDEIQAIGVDFLPLVMHPRTLTVAPTILPSFHAQKDSTQVMTFMQYIKPRGDSDYLPVITFAKPPEDDTSPIVCISPFPSDFDRLSRKMERVVEMDTFQFKHFERFQSLTKREVQVLRMLATGHNNRQIAEALSISRPTVETHRKRLKAKLELKNFRDLWKFSIAFGLVNF